MMEYPVTFYRKGWDDLSDWILVESAEHEAECRREGFKHMNEFSTVAETSNDVAEIQQIAHNDATPKRRGRPPRVKHDDSGATD